MSHIYGKNNTSVAPTIGGSVTSTQEGNRILLKVSGESLRGKENSVTDPKELARLAREIEYLHRVLGVEVAIVVGAGNIWRGAEHPEMERAQADYAGMMATVTNAMAIQGVLESMNIETRVMSAIKVDSACEPYIRLRAIRHLEKGRVVICAGGTGNPYFTTDTAAVLRALELDCNNLYMGKNGVDGVYDSDPRLNPEAEHIYSLTHMEALERKLNVMDSTALTLAMDNGLPIVVFNGSAEGELHRVVEDITQYTTITTPS